MGSLQTSSEGYYIPRRRKPKRKGLMTLERQAAKKILGLEKEQARRTRNGFQLQTKHRTSLTIGTPSWSPLQVSVTKETETSVIPKVRGQTKEHKK